MRFCSNCGHPVEDGNKFCGACGAAVVAPVAAEPVPAQPVMAEPTPVQPVVAEPVSAQPVRAYEPARPVAPAVPATPVPATKDKVLGFVGMGLAIGGLFFGVIGLLYGLIFIAGDFGAATTGFSIGFGIFSLPLSIVGRILCNRSMAAGNISTPCSVGRKLGLAGIIVSAVMYFFGFVGLLTV